MGTREQDLQVINGIISVAVGNRHLELLKSRIAGLQNKQKEVNEKLNETSKEEYVIQEPSFVIKHAPVVGAIVGAFVVLQFLGFTILGLAGIIGLLISVVAAVAIGYVAGIVIKKNAISQQEKNVQQNKERNSKEKENLKNQLNELKKNISGLQKEVKDTQEDVALLKRTYLSDKTLASFCNTYGIEEAEILKLYFERGRADSIEEAMELYKDEAADKARIKRAREEIDRSVAAYINAYVNAMKVFGRSREYSSLETSLDKYNDSLEKENKDLRDFMGVPEKK